MSGQQHPGVKLYAVFNGHYWDVSVGPKDFSQSVGQCHRNGALGYGDDGAERYARLFAAAPDLLEVCAAIAPYLGAIDANDWSGLKDDDAISMPVKMRVGDLRALKAALNKARATEAR